ncbi:hypothetical protein ACJMK2_021203 [Sinanodonta woodiana]|uniref:Uncharacterized protein n=1 Tax=Sinanodonta woodiana TaxID=1069815 RepID=A0ABD3U1I3_SINWO
MDDFGNSNGGLSSSDAAGCSTDACGCSALSSSDTGGIWSSGGVCSDSILFSVDTFSNTVMTSDSGQGVNDYVSCNLTGNNAYYHACVQDSMESENINECATSIPASPFVPYTTTPKYKTLDGYRNKGGNMELWDTHIPCNKTEDKELMFLKSKRAQLQIILASCKGDEYKKTAICAQIEDLTDQIQRKENWRRQDIFMIENGRNQATAFPRVYPPKALNMTPNHAGVDIDKQKRMYKCCCIVPCVLAFVLLTAFALGMGLGFSQAT